MDVTDDTDGDANAGEIQEEPLVPETISNEYFDQLSKNVYKIIKDLQTEQKYGLAEDFQRVLLVGQYFKNFLEQEQIRIEQMNEKVAAAESRVAAALKISQMDHEIIEKLKDEIDKTWKRADVAQSREEAAHEIMDMLKVNIKQLQTHAEKFVDKKDNLTEELGATLGPHKEGILRERDRINAEVEELTRRLQIQRSYTDEVEKKRAESECKLKEMYKLLDATSDEAFKEKKTIEVLKLQLSDVTVEKEEKTAEAEHFQYECELKLKTITHLQTQVANLKSNLEKLSNQHKAQAEKLAKTTSDLESVTQLRNKLLHELSQKSNILKLREDENKKYRLETTKLVKSGEILMKKLMNVEQNKSALDQELLKLKSYLLTFEKERDASVKKFEMMRKDTEKLIRERDLVRKDLMKANHAIADQQEQVVLHEQHIKTLDNEISSHLALQQKLRATILKVEKERDRNAEENQILADKLELASDDLKTKIIQIEEQQEKIKELTKSVSQFQHMFETARSERNATQRELLECDEDRVDLKERLRISTRQIEQFKEDIATKEAELLTAQKAIDKLEREKQTLKLENQQLLVNLQHTKSELSEMKRENERLNKTLSDDEVRLMKLRQELDTALNEKDLIGTQMIRRNDEIGLLNEKLHIIQMALDRGESQYNKRLDDIRLLKIEIANLRSQRNVLTRGLANTADMRQEVLQLHRVVTNEIVKSKALEQEMATPMNIHRWRKLEGKDPDKLDLIFKTQTLQKRLIALTAQATDRESYFQQSHKLFALLKELQKKLPDYKLKERLASTKSALATKNKKLKALAAEVKAKEIDCVAQDCTIEGLKKSLIEIKKKNQLQEKQSCGIRTAH